METIDDQQVNMQHMSQPIKESEKFRHMQEIHWLGSVTDDLVYLPSGVLPMMLLRPPNIPSSKFKSKLGSTLCLSVLRLCTKKRDKLQRASMTRISSKTLEVTHYRTTYQR